MANNCDEQFCDWFAKEGAFLWAPCGTFQFETDGTLTPIDKADFGEVGEDMKWTYEDASSVTINTPRTTNSKATLRCKENCSSTIDTNTIDLELCWCWTNKLHKSLSNPSENCTIDFLYFPQPAICDMPDPATDVYYRGTVKGGTDSIGGAASNTEGETVSVTLTACGSGFRRENCPEDDTSIVIGGRKAADPNLTIEKAAA